VIDGDAAFVATVLNVEQSWSDIHREGLRNRFVSASPPRTSRHLFGVNRCEHLDDFLLISSSLAALVLLQCARGNGHRRRFIQMTS